MSMSEDYRHQCHLCSRRCSWSSSGMDRLEHELFEHLDINHVGNGLKLILCFWTLKSTRGSLVGKPCQTWCTYCIDDASQWYLILKKMFWIHCFWRWHPRWRTSPFSRSLWPPIWSTILSTHGCCGRISNYPWVQSHTRGDPSWSGILQTTF